MQLPQQLHKVASGRVWVRAARAEPAIGHPRTGFPANYNDSVLLLGVIELPVNVDLERMHDVRLNSSLWMDTATATKPRTYMGSLDIKETDVADLMTQFQFKAGFLPDSFEVFVRGSLINHETPGMRWAIIGAPIAVRPAALPKDGLYEFGGTLNGFKHVSDNCYIGAGPTQAIRDAIWGPDGKYGTSTSLEPEHFPTWLQSERSRPPRSYEEPKFRAFVKVMAERSPELHVYTAEQKAARDQLCTTVIKELMELELQGLPLPGASEKPAAAAPAHRRNRP